MATNRFNVNETLGLSSALDLTGRKKDMLNERWQEYNLIYANNLTYLTNIATSLGRWKGLPGGKGEPLRSSFFETMLMLNGSAIIGETPTYGMIVAPCTVQGGLNPYGNPVEVKLSPAYCQEYFSALNMTLKNTPEKKTFVYCRNDNFGNSIFPLISETAEILTTIRMSTLANLSQQKFPVIVTASKEEKLSMEIITNKIDAWESYIMLKSDTPSGITNKSFGAINKDVPYVADKLQQAYIDTLNNFFQRLGINSTQSEKRERLLQDEVNANNQATIISGSVYEYNRKEICQNAKEVFGLELEFEWNTELVDSLMKNVSRETFSGEEEEEDE